MNKPLFNFVKILVLVFVLFFSLEDVDAQFDSDIPTGQTEIDRASNLNRSINRETPTQEKGILDRASTAFVEWVAPEGSILATIFPTTKNCDYVNKKLYQPFSAIDKTFPGAETLGFIEVNNRDTKEGGKITCISVGSGTEDLLKILFTLLISIIIILSVINISVSGIQYMTEEATGQIKGGAKKRLQNSLIALALGLLSYTILYTVNKQLVAFNFDPAKQLNTEGSVDGGIAKAREGLNEGSFSTSFSSVEALQQSVNVGGFYGPGTPGSPYLTQPGSQPSYNETLAQSNFSTYASFGSISCSGVRCVSSKPTVFGYKDGDGTVGSKGDNGIGNASWSTKPGCTYDTGNTVTLGVALPQGFWRSASIPLSDVKYVGVRVFVNNVFQKVLPVVDDSQQNLDFTFAAARAYIDPTITNSNRLNTSGKSVSFEIIKDYYKTNPKTNIVWTSNKSTFTNKIPCNI